MQMQHKLHIYHYRKGVNIMFLMQKEEVQSELKKINDYLSKCSWMDFEFCQMNASQVVMVGSIDQSYNKHAINIKFEQPHFVSSLFLWKTDISKPFIQLVSEEEQFEINTNYQVEQGNYIFKINVEDFEKPPIFIAAKKIFCIILDENPFSKS